MLRKRECQVAGATAEIEYEGIGSSKDVLYGSRRPCPPKAVKPKTQQMVRAVIGRRDAVKHRANILGHLIRRGDAFRTRAGGGGCGFREH